jgi:Tfp pilus assembly protein PilN
MRAVNLIPSDQRAGSSVGAGRSEGAAYGVLALIVAVAVLALLYGKAHRDVASDTAKAATAAAAAQRAQSEASALAPYESFIALRTQREQAVASLVDSRFDWAHAFHEFGRVLTNKTQIESLDGSIAAGTAPAATTTATSTASSSVTSATPAGSVPTFTIAGCATSQPAVATMLERLRLIDGVSQVTLLSSTDGGSSPGSSGGCPPKGPAFSVTVTFDALPTATAAAAALKAGAAQTVSDKSAATRSTAALKGAK